jgi:molybdopterin converting factor small subunit
MPPIRVELFGIPRQRAGVATAVVDADTVADALRLLRVQHAGLADLLNGDGELSPHYLLSLDGVAFVRDLAAPLADHAKLLLLSADAGG